MDSDDISRSDRCERTLGYMRDSALDICGAYIEEFALTPRDTGSIRKLSQHHYEIVKYDRSITH